MDQPTRILLIEDDPPTRERLADIVKGVESMSLIGSAPDCAAARALVKEQHPDVVLTDLGLPDGSGIDLIREFGRLKPRPAILVISVFGDEKHVVAAIEAGADGYLLKDSHPERIKRSIEQILAGDSPISPGIARHLLRKFKEQPAVDPASEPPPDLTPREMDVLQLVAKGFSYAEIATTLEVSVHTVTSHIKHIYAKLQVRSRGEAVFEAVQRGLLVMRDR